MKGYGFIEGDDGKDYFVHYKALPEGTFLNENDRVTFEPAETDRGPQAQNVQLGGEAPAEEEPAQEEEAPAEEAPAEEEPTQEEEAPTEEAPAEEAPTQEEEAPAEEPKEE